MKLLIAGSRSLEGHLETPLEAIEAIIKERQIKPTTILSGMAKGPDYWGYRYGKFRNIPVEKFIPDWDEHGKKAGFLRNLELVNAADYAIIFLNKTVKSNGTRHTIGLLKEAQKPFTLMAYDTVSGAVKKEEFEYA